MIDAAWLASTLTELPLRIKAWQAQAGQLRHLVTTAQISGNVSDELLHATEENCSSLRDEIIKCDELIQNVAGSSPTAASQLAPVSDALHLVLLETTELSTELYAARSRLGKVAAPLLE